MKKSKKIFSIVLSLILIISITTTVLIATANTKETAVEITVDKAELSVGQSATVSVKVTANYPIATMSIPVFYDKTLVDVSDATATLTDYSVKNAITESESADTSKVYANTGVNSEKFGFVIVNYIGGAGKDVPETMDSVVLTFKITAKAGASGTEVIKCVSKSAKTDENIAGMLYFGSPVSGRNIDSIPENVKNIDLTKAQASVVISTAGATLVANSDTSAVVNYENNYIYGVEAGVSAEELAEYFSVANGTFDMVANDGGYTNGTGATLVVKDNKGNEVDAYTLIIFGDVNGDGVVTATDANIVQNITLGGIVTGEVYNYASNVNGDDDITATDANIIRNASLGGEITVNPYAK